MTQLIDLKSNSITLQIPVGYSCNNNCLFCMEEDRVARFRKLKSTTIQDIEKILDEKIHLNKVIFTSGEPTLNPNLLRYIKLAKTKGYKDVGLVTNGRKLSYKAYCAALLTAGISEVIISIHSTKKKVHEALTRTKDSFKQSWEGLINMCGLKKDHNFKLYVSLVLNKFNYDNVDEDIKIFSKLPIDALILNTLQPLGRGDKKHLLPRYTDIVKKIKELQSNKRTPPNFSVADIPPCLSDPIKNVSGNLEQYHIKEGKRYSYPVLKDKIKRKECKDCKYDSICIGVWKNYIKHYGWSEFQPHKK